MAGFSVFFSAPKEEILYNFTVKKVMIYGVDGGLLEKLESAFDILQIGTIVIGDDVLDETVGSVMDKDGSFSDRHTEFDMPYMVGQEMTAQEFVKCLGFLELFGTPFEGIKVLRTPDNENWTIRSLFQKARKSFDTLKDTLTLKQLIADCENLYGSAGEASSRAMLKKRTESAKKLLASGNCAEESVKRAIQELTDCMNSYRKLYN